MRYIPTGIEPVDTILGGGFPVGVVTEIRGDEGCGKSTLALRALQVARDNWDAPFSGVYLSTADYLPSHLGRKDLDGLFCLYTEDRLMEEYIRGIYSEKPDCIVLDSPSTLPNSPLRSLLAVSSSAANMGAAVIVISDTSICRRDRLFSGYVAVQMDMRRMNTQKEGGFASCIMCKKNSYHTPRILRELQFPLEDNYTNEARTDWPRTRPTY